MSLRALILTIAVAVLVATQSVAQERIPLPPPKSEAVVPSPTRPETSIHRLRNVAAADVAGALMGFVEDKKLAATVIADPVSNSVVVAGDPGSHKQLVALIAAIDKQPAQIQAEILFMEVPAGFAETIGLAEPNKAADLWVLTGRETRMLHAAIREAKKDGIVDILARPAVMMADNQTGYVEIGGDTRKIVSRITPRTTPDGLLARIDVQVMKKDAHGPGIQSIQTTAKVPDHGTFVVRLTKPDSTEKTEILGIITLHAIVK